MLFQQTNRAAADELLRDATTVERVHPGAGVDELPSELEALAEALRAAGRALAMSASRVVPAAEPFDPSVCSRYQRAAARWPTAAPPSHERFAAALARFHDAADATRLAGRRCDEARRTVEALLRPAANAPSQ
jgi:hypothetical protein